MSFFLGIDTSNYTTSTALYDSDTNSVISKKRLLPVKSGEKGIRQSDAVFHHTVALPDLMSELFEGENHSLSGIGVSVKPSNQEGSYMPCFLAGVSVAKGISAALGIKLYEFSHQDGHIAAALYSADMLSLIEKEFIAFHISGGTSQALLVSPCGDYFKTKLLSQSLDLNAGQAVDRVGVSLGLDFPCGAELEKEALKLNLPLKKLKIFRKDGCFSLSGVENQCADMLKKGLSDCEIAHHCLSSIYSAIYDTAVEISKQYGGLPMVFSGGVMSNSLIRNGITADFDAYFAKPEFSADNAAGIAVLASVCSKGSV